MGSRDARFEQSRSGGYIHRMVSPVEAPTTRASSAHIALADVVG
jgi:hypothetical protein